MRAWRRIRGEGVSGSRWLSGVVIGLLLVGVVAVGGIALGGGGGNPSPGANESRNELYMTLRIPGITDFGPKGEIEVEAFHWGVSQVAGRIVVEELVITKVIDKASPKLYEALTKGTHLEEVTLAVYEGRGGEVALDFKEYVVYAIRDVMVSSIGEGPTPAGHMEDVSFTYREISIDYTAQGGPVETLLCGTGADWSGCERK